MIQDRGLKKWTAMMLPEHIEKLAKWNLEASRETRSSLMDWELAHIQQHIQRAYEEKLSISLTLYQDYRHFIVTGLIEQLNPDQSVLSFKTTERVYQVSFDSIQGADIDDFYT